MRRALVVLLIATICSFPLAQGVAHAKGTLRVNHRDRQEGQKVVISGKTGCKKKPGVHVHAHAKKIHNKWRRAFKSGKPVKVRGDGTFSTKRTIRRSAIDNKSVKYRIESHCKNANGKLSGRTKLTVKLPRTGLPVLPQLLLGFGLIGGGTALLRVNLRAGGSGRRRRRSMKPPRVRREGMIARWALKGD
jgi:hypothetical protein